MRTAPDAEIQEIEVEKGITAETLAKKYQSGLPYQILAAKINNRVRGLTAAIDESCSVTLLDIRDQTANLIYQRSVSFIYLKAIHDVLGNVKVLIENSLIKGVYTDIKNERPGTG